MVNPSFEQYTACPTGSNGIAAGWLVGWSAIDSPDFFNVCSSVASEVNVPDNFFGFQYAKNGYGYAGVISYTQSNNVREFIQSQLSQTLSLGIPYCVKFYINFGDTSYFSINKFGALFSDTAVVPFSISYGYPFLLPFTPQIQYTGNIISDTLNWIEVSGTFYANGTENYITLGNFEYDSLTSVAIFDSVSGWAANYFYIDDISVEEVKTARAVNDTLLCVNADSVMIGINVTENASYSWQPSTGLSDANAPNPKAKPTVTTTYYVTKTQCSVVSTDSVTISIYDCTIYPIQIPTLITANEYWELKHLEPNTQVWVYNSIGQLVYKESNYQNKLNAQLLASGIYIYNIETARGDFYKGKLEVVK